MSQTYNLVPPPGAAMAGFSLRKSFRKLKRGVSKAAHGTVNVAKRGAKGGFKLAKKGVHIALTPQRLMLKYGLKALSMMGKLAAKPIQMVFRKLALRRAKWVSWHARKSLAPNAAEKAQGGAYAIKKMGGNPLGKLGVAILKHTWGTGVSGDLEGCPCQGGCRGCSQRQVAGEVMRDASALGMTGVEIAAAAASIVGAVSAIMKALNKPGEAPEDPTKEPSKAADATPSDNPPADAPAQAPTEAPAQAPADSSEGLDIMDTAGVVAALCKAGMTPKPIAVVSSKPFKPTRWLTLAEVDHVCRTLRKQRGGDRTALENAVVALLYAKGVGIVPDVNALPAREVAARKASGATSLLGAGMKKAYRNRKSDWKGPQCNVPPSDPAGGPSADEIMRQAERYGGYRSAKEYAKARARGEAQGELSPAGNAWQARKWISPADAELIVQAYMNPGSVLKRYRGQPGLSREDAEKAVMRDLKARRIGIHTADGAAAGDDTTGNLWAVLQRLKTRKATHGRSRFGTSRRGAAHFGATKPHRPRAWERF